MSRVNLITPALEQLLAASDALRGAIHFNEQGQREVARQTLAQLSGVMADLEALAEGGQ